MEPVLLNIMLVEDDDVDIMSLKRSFRKNNIQNSLFIANDGMEALDMLRGTNGKEKIVPMPMIIISDINMPKMNGLEMLKEIRADKEFDAISVFIFTTSDLDTNRHAAQKHNVAGYIVKPINMENFIEAVSKLHHNWRLVGNDKTTTESTLKYDGDFRTGND